MQLRFFLTNHILPEPFRILCAVRLRTCKPCLGRLCQVLVTNFLPQTDLAPVLHRQAEASGNVDKAGQIFVVLKVRNFGNVIHPYNILKLTVRP